MGLKLSDSENPDDYLDTAYEEVHKKYGLNRDNIYSDPIAKLKEVIAGIRPNPEDYSSHLLWAVALDILDMMQIVQDDANIG